MLDATEEEAALVEGYMASQAPDLKVTFLQKMHVEIVLGHCHDVWDVHCDNRGALVGDHGSIGISVTGNYRASRHAASPSRPPTRSSTRRSKAGWSWRALTPRASRKRDVG
jgi:hypothetical protein